MQNLARRLLPFFIAGIALVVMFFGMVLLAYLLIFGTIVGIVLFLINWIRDNFRGTKKSRPPTTKSQGRVIDSNDWRKL